MKPKTRHIGIILFISIQFAFLGCNCDSSEEYNYLNTYPRKEIMDLVPYKGGETFQFVDKSNNEYELRVISRMNNVFKLRTDPDYQTSNCDGLEFDIVKHNVTFLQMEFPNHDGQDTTISIKVYLNENAELTRWGEVGSKLVIGNTEPFCIYKGGFCRSYEWWFSSEINIDSLHNFSDFERIESIVIGNRVIDHAYAQKKGYYRFDSIMSEIVYSKEYGILRFISNNNDTLDRVFE